MQQAKPGTSWRLQILPHLYHLPQPENNFRFTLIINMQKMVFAQKWMLYPQVVTRKIVSKGKVENMGQIKFKTVLDKSDLYNLVLFLFQNNWVITLTWINSKPAFCEFLPPTVTKIQVLTKHQTETIQTSSWCPKITEIFQAFPR